MDLETTGVREREGEREVKNCFVLTAYYIVPRNVSGKKFLKICLVRTVTTCTIGSYECLAWICEGREVRERDTRKSVFESRLRGQLAARGSIGRGGLFEIRLLRLSACWHLFNIDMRSTQSSYKVLRFFPTT